MHSSSKSALEKDIETRARSKSFGNSLGAEDLFTYVMKMKV